MNQPHSKLGQHWTVRCSIFDLLAKWIRSVMLFDLMIETWTNYLIWFIMSICNPGSPKFAPMVKIIQKISPTAANLFSAYSRNEIKPIAHAQSTKPVQDRSCLILVHRVLWRPRHLLRHLRRWQGWLRSGIQKMSVQNMQG